MRNIIKTSFYSMMGIILVGLQHANAAIDSWQQKVQGGIQGSTDTADVTIQNYISTALNYLYLAAVIYALWGGFNILTAAGDDEKVKKGKTVIVHAAIWVLIIFLANSIVWWLIGIVSGQ